VAPSGLRDVIYGRQARGYLIEMALLLEDLDLVDGMGQRTRDRARILGAE
jgi:hypothetical protein